MLSEADGRAGIFSSTRSADGGQGLLDWIQPRWEGCFPTQAQVEARDAGERCALMGRRPFLLAGPSSPASSRRAARPAAGPFRGYAACPVKRVLVFIFSRS